MISITNKSDKITVFSMDSYLEQGAPHVAKDTPVTWDHFKKGNNLALCHVRAIRVFSQ